MSDGDNILIHQAAGAYCVQDLENICRPEKEIGKEKYF